MRKTKLRRIVKYVKSKHDDYLSKHQKESLLKVKPVKKVKKPVKSQKKPLKSAKSVKKPVAKKTVKKKVGRPPKKKK